MTRLTGMGGLQFLDQPVLVGPDLSHFIGKYTQGPPFSSYAYEALLINEFSGRYFACTNLVPSGPGYSDTPLQFKSCSTVGSLAGHSLVSGDDFIKAAYNYEASHKWRQVEYNRAIFRIH